jgi:enoyl-CoA hydratase
MSDPAMKSFVYLQLEIDDAVAVITINRPDKLNALNTQLLAELEEVIEMIADNEQVHVAVITGAGQKAFVAGADIGEMHLLDSAEALAFSLNGQRIFQKIEDLPKPVIAAVNGFALGGGAELAWACHIRIASENAAFGQPEINLGLIPGYGGTQRLTRLLPRSKVYQLFISGDQITASEALSFGLVNAVYASGALLTEAVTLAKRLAEKPAAVVKLLMRAIQATSGPFAEGLGTEASLFSACFGTEDFHEGTTAFLEKRKPIFKHK